VAPHLRGWEAVLRHQCVGVYANSETVDCPAGRPECALLATRLGFDEGFRHPAAHLQRVEFDERSVGGVGVVLNHVLKPRFGQ
jgi:hypothetical protein